MIRIEHLAGIETSEAEQLRRHGIATVSQLTEQTATSIDRINLADRAGIDHERLAVIVHHADIMRVQGMTPEIAHALYDVGCTSAPKLAYQQPSHLYQLLQSSGTTLTTKEALTALIAAAKKVPKIIRH